MEVEFKMNKKDLREDKIVSTRITWLSGFGLMYPPPSMKWTINSF